MTVGIAWGISIESFPYILTAGEVTIPSVSDSTKWEPADDMPNGCGQAAALATPKVSWSEMMTPIEGGLDVSMVSFKLYDVLVSYNGADVRLCSYLLGRDPANITSTVLLRTASEGSLDLEIPTTAPSALTSGYPKVLYLGDEAVNADSYSGGVIYLDNATGRGYYGSRPKAYQHRADSGLYPEIWVDPPTILGRRVILWAIENGIAYAVWRGYVSRGPDLQSDGSWSIQCDHVWTREKNRSLGDPSVSAKFQGFERSAVNLGVICQNSYASGTLDSGTRTWYGWNGGGAKPMGGDVVNGDVSYDAEAFCTQLQQILTARLTGTSLTGTGTTTSHTPQTNVAVRVERSGRSVQFSVRCGTTGTQPELAARVLTQEFKATTKDEGGGVYSGTLTFDLPPVALTFEVGKEQALSLSETIDVSPRAGADPSADPSYEVAFTQTWSDGAFRTTAQTVLAGEYDERTRLVVYPTGRNLGRVAYVSRDSAPVESANANTFAGLAFGGMRTYYGGESRWGGAPTIFVDRPVRVSKAQRVTCEHWVYGIQHALEGGALSTESDPRNWDWSTADTVASVTAHELSSREWYLDGSMKMGSLLADPLVLDGCGMVIRSGGRMAIVPVRQPMAHWAQGYESTAIAATINRGDLVAGSVPTWKPLTDALISSAKIATGADQVLVHDDRTRQKWGQKRIVELALSGLPPTKQGGNDARSLGNRALTRIIGLWGEPRFACTFTLPMDRLYGSRAIYGGDFVLLNDWHLPDGAGGRGLSNVPVFILGREVNLADATITFTALLLPVAYGYAPCVKLNDMDNDTPSAGKATLAAATQYVYAGAADENDYAGGISTDLGVGWFSAGDKVMLMLRDATTGLREVSLTVDSVNTGTGQIVLTTNVPLVPYDWVAAVAGGAWVDLTFDQATVQTAATQKSFAYVGTGTAGEGTIAFSGDTQRSRKYAS